MNDDTFGVRICHFAHDAPALDFLVDGYPVLTDVNLGDVPDYTEHEAREYRVSARETESETALLEEVFDFEGGTYHTLLLHGTAEDPQFRLLKDGQRSASAIHG